MKSVTLEQLLEVGAHFGHQSRRWNPRMAPYLYGVQGGVHLFDLVKTKKGLEDACEFVEKLTREGGEIIFVGTKRQAADIIREEAKRVGAPYVAQRWLGGTITNWEQIRKSIRQLVKMREDKAAGGFNKYTKKEQLLLDRKITRFERFLEGLVNLEKTPDALFIVDVKTELPAVKEARMKGIPVVAVADSNVDPTMVDYVIPGNDDAIKSVKLLVTYIADAYEKGKQTRAKKQAATEKETEKPAVSKSQSAEN